MKQLKVQYSEKSDSEITQEGIQDPFLIVKNYRQTVLLRIQRKIKKQKKLNQKKMIQEQLNQDYRIRNQILNKNMLNDEEMWNKITDDSKMSYQKQRSQQTTYQPSKLEIAKEFIHSLVYIQKKNIFMNQFELFTMNH